jgi:hypothetical protein
MEIHKVKPIHTWRDFLKELGTIVLGIIIAIALEHFVESWSWDRDVKVARQAIHGEIVANNDNLFAMRIAIAPCVDRQINEVDKVLTAAEAGLKPERNIALRYALGSLPRDSEWQSERASQVLTHFPRAELAIMSRYYAQLPIFVSWGELEGTAWQELSILEKPQTDITTPELNRLRVALRSAADAEYLTVLNARRQLNLSKQLGVPDPTPGTLRVKNFCTLSRDDFRRYRSSQDLR